MRLGSRNQPSIGVSRLAQGGPKKFTDIHCHCLPNMDDGPQSIQEAAALCLLLARDGIGTVVATPHQLGRFEGHTGAAKVRETAEWLNDALADEGVALRVLPGAEVRLDERIGAFLVEDVILTLADMRRHILVELPDDAFIDLEPLLVQLADLNVALIIAHPERNIRLLRHPQAIRRWLICGASFQVTAASLTGHLGPEAHRAAWQLMAQGWVDVVATDAHDRCERSLCMRPAFEMIGATFGQALADLLCIENPFRVLMGESLVQAFSLKQEVG